MNVYIYIYTYTFKANVKTLKVNLFILQFLELFFCILTIIFKCI